MIMNELASIIVPAYNEEKLIERTLISLKNQTYKPTEIIVVDNNSTDRTGKIAEKYADKVLFLKDRGAAKARNLGAKKARGSFIFFIDADSKLSKNAVEKCVSALKNNYPAGTAKIIYESEDYKVKSIELIQNFCLEQWKIFESGFLYARKDAFEKVGGYKGKINFGENMDLLKRISKLGPLHFEKKAFLLTSPRRFVRSKDYLYALLGGFLALSGVKNIPLYAIRNEKEDKKIRAMIKNLLNKKISLSPADWKLIWVIIRRERFKELFDRYKKFFNII